MLPSSLVVTLISPERMTWSMQRLIKNLRRADETNLDAIIDKVGIDSSWDGPRLDQICAEDRAVAQSIDVFFPGALRGVQVADKLNAGGCEHILLKDLLFWAGRWQQPLSQFSSTRNRCGGNMVFRGSQGLLQYGNFPPNGRWRGLSG